MGDGRTDHGSVEQRVGASAEMRRALFDATAECRRLERELRDSEERYRTVVDTAGESIAIVDARGVFQFMNTTAGQRLGGRPADFVGKTMWELFPAEVADAQAAHVRAVIESGQGRTTVSLTNVRGAARWYCTTVEPLRDDAGTVTAGLIVARDIHEFQTARQELDAYREKMIRAEHRASLGTLSAMLSHEMTQPLMVIGLSIQNAMKTLEGASGGPAVLEDLREALAGVANATALVQRFRDAVGRMPQGATGAVSLSAVACRVVRLLDESAHKARLALDVDLPGDLPPIQSDAKEIEQVFFILAQNAVQAADGVRDHSFHIRGAARAGTVELQFADDCGGIDPKILKHVFEPFVTTKPPGEGMGLGLCVVQRIVSQVGGRLKVDSRWGEGTTFFLTLPRETKRIELRRGASAGRRA